jgi:DNA-directed RNA polymerase subunit RPC12/RpoP
MLTAFSPSTVRATKISRYPCRKEENARVFPYWEQTPDMREENYVKRCRSREGWHRCVYEHRRYFTNGFRCPRCEVRLLSALGRETAQYFSSDGSRKLGTWEKGLWPIKRLGGSTVECPKCGYRWAVLSATTPPQTTEALDIVETDRSEEFFGEDRRVIDNSSSSIQVTRNFTFSKEWSKSFSLDFERATTDGLELTVGTKDTAALKLSSEEKLRRTYSLSQETKETVTEEVSCQVPPHTRTTVVVRWKRIWQHGLVHTEQSGVRLRIPFRLAVGLTFDQRQIDGEDTRAKA